MKICFFSEVLLQNQDLILHLNLGLKKAVGGLADMMASTVRLGVFGFL